MKFVGPVQTFDKHHQKYSKSGRSSDLLTRVVQTTDRTAAVMRLMAACQRGMDSDPRLVQDGATANLELVAGWMRAAADPITPISQLVSRASDVYVELLPGGDHLGRVAKKRYKKQLRHSLQRLLDELLHLDAAYGDGSLGRRVK